MKYTLFSDSFKKLRTNKFFLFFFFLLKQKTPNLNTALTRLYKLTLNNIINHDNPYN